MPKHANPPQNFLGLMLMEIIVFVTYALPELILQYQRTKGSEFIRIVLPGLSSSSHNQLKKKKEKKTWSTDQYFLCFSIFHYFSRKICWNSFTTFYKNKKKNCLRFLLACACIPMWMWSHMLREQKACCDTSAGMVMNHITPTTKTQAVHKLNLPFPCSKLLTLPFQAEKSKVA